jgi:hypothetical protein
MQSGLNGEETREIPGTEGKGQYIFNVDSNSTLGSKSRTSGREQVRINRDDGSKRESTNFRRRETLTGKLLRQLIGEYRDQVAAKKSEIERLESKIQDLETIEEELNKTND